ncbi:MAG TPA: peptide-methionine (S)-S-oxide reductase MsrA [Parcubacteria group bacterium]|jgi:peptide-methionine (S)-S-oxide reductase|nr:peptide-methionine (S)-S-oxide reductase MsrA [Parcubacteria group bacterium]
MKNETAVFGGGCFWCTEAVFKMLKGVSSVLPGYSGGKSKYPTYAEVSMGDSGHAECTKVEFDPEVISYKDLLTVFFGSHDPTTLNRQGADVGTQYRSVIFYTTEEQKKTAEDFIKEINASSKEGKPVVTEVVPLTAFYEAENYHKDYYERNKEQPYCEIVINPKLEKIVKDYGNLLNNKYKHKNG